MDYETKEKLMSQVYKTLNAEKINYTKIAFNSIARVKENNFTFDIGVNSNNDYYLESGDSLVCLYFDSIGKLFDTVYFLYHTVKEN